jgi:hypothetical protein
MAVFPSLRALPLNAITFMSFVLLDVVELHNGLSFCQKRAAISTK